MIDQRIGEFKEDDILNTSPYKYKVKKLIGQGSFGQVYQCSLQNNKPELPVQKPDVAIKVLDQKLFELYPKSYMHFNREVQILKSCHHPNILRFIDVQDDSQNYYLLTELCNQGNLENFMRKVGEKRTSQHKITRWVLSETQALFFMEQLISAFHYLHNINKDQIVVHRDIKMTNILVHNGQLKLGDLGFSRSVQEGQKMESHLGSPLTVAPEITMKKKYDSRVDVFSLGIVFYQMLFGFYPFQERTPEKMLEVIKGKDYSLIQSNIIVSKKTQHLITKMLEFDCDKRITFEELFQMFKIEKPGKVCFSEVKSSYKFKNSLIQQDNDIEKVKVKILGTLNEQNRNMEKIFKDRNTKQQFKIQKLLQRKFKIYFEDTQGFQKYDSIPQQELRADGYFIILNMLEDRDPIRIIHYWLKKIRATQGLSFPVKNSIQIILNTEPYDQFSDSSCAYDFSDLKKDIIAIYNYCKYELDINCIQMKLNEQKRDKFYSFLESFLFRISQFQIKEDRGSFSIRSNDYTLVKDRKIQRRRLSKGKGGKGKKEFCC